MTKFTRFGLIMDMVSAVLAWAAKSTASDSPGGKEITDGEIADLIREAGNQILTSANRPYRLKVELVPSEELKAQLRHDAQEG